MSGRGGSAHPGMKPPVEPFLEIHRRFDAPYDRFDDSMLGPEFARELALVSRLWFHCGYRPGIGVTLNFLLLGEFLALHQQKYPSRFPSLRAMMAAFHRIDVFVRAVTDSGDRPTGGISSARVRGILAGIGHRHGRSEIPEWMLTYFGFNVLEMVEAHCPLSAEEKRLHLAYIGKVFRLMGVPFTQDRRELERFARAVENRHAAVAADAPRLLGYVLCVAEMAGVSSGWESVLRMLPQGTRAVFEPLYPRVRPGLPRRLACRLLGRLLLPRAVGAPRAAVPANQKSCLAQNHGKAPEGMAP